MNRFNKLILRYLEKKSIQGLLATFLLMVVSSLCTVTLPVILKNVFDNIDHHSLVVNYMAIYALLMILERLFNEFQFIVYPNFENKILANAYRQTFNGIFRNKFVFFKGKFPGEISVKLYQAINGLDTLMFDFVFKSLPLVINFIFIITFICLNFNFFITVIILLGSLFFIWVTRIFNRAIVKCCV
ncbi:MAG: hypothetical protein WA253_00080 [Gammaproteobacteria bacterium]